MKMSRSRRVWGKDGIVEIFFNQKVHSLLSKTCVVIAKWLCAVRKVQKIWKICTFLWNPQILKDWKLTFHCNITTGQAKQIGDLEVISYFHPLEQEA